MLLFSCILIHKVETHALPAQQEEVLVVSQDANIRKHVYYIVFEWCKKYRQLSVLLLTKKLNR